jgi:hypothetical protein
MGESVKTSSLYSLIILLVLVFTILYPTATNTESGSSGIVFNNPCSIEAVATYRYGNANVVLVYLNPIVYYSYRNFYLIHGGLCFNFVTPDYLPESLLKERVGRVKAILLERGINVSIDTGVEYLELYPDYVIAASYIYIDFTNKSIEEVKKIVDVVGTVVSDLNATIAIYDTRLLELHELYEKRGVLEISRLGPIEAEIWPITDELKKALGECITGIGGFPSVAVSPTFKAWWYLFAMHLDPEIPYCTIEGSVNRIEPYLKKMIDVIRDNLIPEEIPIYATINLAKIYSFPPILTTTISTPEPYTPDSTTPYSSIATFPSTTTSPSTNYTFINDTRIVTTSSPLVNTPTDEPRVGIYTLIAIVALLVTIFTALTMHSKRSMKRAHAIVQMTP